MHRITGVLLLLSLALTGYGQGRKTIRDKGIESMTVQEYFIEEGIREPAIESIEKYNEDGDLVEIQEFSRKGEIRKWEKYAYDEEGNLVEQVFLDEKGRTERTERNLYEDGLRVEKQFFDERDRLYKKKVYVYEYRR